MSSSSSAISSTPRSQARASSGRSRAARSPRAAPPPAQQGQRRLGARRLGDVVRHGGPEGDRRDAEPGARVLEDPDDAGRPLVGRRLQLEPVDELGLGGVAGHRDRPGVRGVGQHRAQGDDSSPPSSSQAASISAQNCRQRMFGSMPRTRTTSRSSSGGEATAIRVVGQAMRRCPRRQRRPSAGSPGSRSSPRGRARPRARVPDPDQVVDHPGGGVPGVVPALEGGDDHGIDQVGDVLDLDHLHSLVPAVRRFRAVGARCHDAGTVSIVRTRCLLAEPWSSPDQRPLEPAHVDRKEPA